MKRRAQFGQIFSFSSALIEWAKVGLPVMLITCTVATLFMIVFYDIIYV
jgi:hypothetical protein